MSAPEGFGSPTDSISKVSPALSLASTLVEASARTPVRHRSAFVRLPSVAGDNQIKYDPVKDNGGTSGTPARSDSPSASGLGITFSTDSPPGGPAVYKPYRDLGTGRLLSPDDGSPSLGWSPRNTAERSVTSLQSSERQNFTSHSESQPLRSKHSFTDTLRLHYDGRIGH